MSNAISELGKLDFAGLEWITELKNKLCNNSEITQNDVVSAFQKVLSQTKIEDTIVEDEVSEYINEVKSLRRLYENTNVAGLSNNNSISFSPVLTIIYGKNGSGKSSYYKILKDAFHSKQDIVGNIYSNTNDSTSAKIDFVNRDTHLRFQRRADSSNYPSGVETINWNPGNLSKSKVKFCDKEILNSSLYKKDTGWSVDRYKLGYYDIFRDAVDKVELLVDQKISDLSKTYSQKYNLISSNLKSDEADSLKTRLDEIQNDGKRLIELLNELLNQVNPDDYEEQIVNLEKKKNLSVRELNEKRDLLRNKLGLIGQLNNYYGKKSQVYLRLEEISQKIKRLKELKNSVDLTKLKQYELLFDPIKNRDKYISLVQVIAETAISIGLDDYPKNVDKCFYCNQTLPEKNKTIIEEIHALIDKQVSEEIKESSTEIDVYISSINEVIGCTIPDYQFSDIAEIYSIEDRSKIDLEYLAKNLNTNTELVSITTELDVPNEVFEYNKSLVSDIEIIESILLSESLSIKASLADVTSQIEDIEKIKKRAESRILKLQDVNFCVGQKQLIQEIINTLNGFWSYKNVKGQFQGIKTKISKDKGRVEEELIRKDYLKKFNEHLDYFGLHNRDKISRPFSNPEGKSKIDAIIETDSEEFELDTILSEGEAKVCSLCDWFTELDFDENEILVFDDPITSLDQPNIQKTVEKILSHCSGYQVIVFTHNFEFYHRLIQKSLGGSPLQKGKCELCKELPDSDTCIGLHHHSGKVHKCGTYYQIEHILNPGFLNEEVMFLSLDWEPRLDILRNNLLRGDIKEADKHLRTTINNFFERYILGDIKRKVYKNNDLIKEWRDIKSLEESDYNDLMDVHNKVSGEGTIHESSLEVRTAMDVNDYIREFNKTVNTINNIRSFNNPSPPRPIELIVVRS